MLLELVIGLLSVVLVWDYLHKRRTNRIYTEQGIHGPSTVPLLGNALQMSAYNPESIFELFKELASNYGKIWRLWVLHEPTVGVSDARILEAILSSQQVITKNKLYDLLYSWLGTGLLLSTGKKWHSRRKIITPTFHFKILEQFVEVFDEQSKVLVGRLAKHADGRTTVNIAPMVCLTALDIIAETAMGVKVNAQTQPDFPYVKSVTTVTEITSMRFIKASQRFDTLMRITAPFEFQRLQRSIALMHKFTDKVIQERRDALQKSIADGTYQPTLDDADVGTKKRMALLDVLLQSTVNGQVLSNTDIREEVDTFMFEGHDTTTSGISFILYLLSRHSEVQQRLFDEIRDVIGEDKEKPVTMRELQDLKYMECVIKEGLRLYPPVPSIGRYVTEDIVLGGKLLPVGTNLMLLIFQALRDPDYFAEPDAFKPERFDASATEQIDPFAYVPFSAGPRNCIGQKFAVLELKSTISKVLRHFELLPLGPDVRLQMNLVMRSSNGINLGVKPRIAK